MSAAGRLQMLWTSGEVEMLLRLKNEGLSDALIAIELNRSPKAVAGKVEYLNLSPLQREERRQALHKRRLASRVSESKRLHPNGQIIEGSRPKHELLTERQTRYSAPARDLTALYMGDPPVGYSALERRA